MPIYEYECASCLKEFELRRSWVDADARTYCTYCGKDCVRRKISISNFYLKGDGWYKPSGGKPGE